MNNPESISQVRHFTATAFVINSKQQCLLLWHKRLQRWMPPGGHIDPNELPEETARRECKEETGLDVEIIGDTSARLSADPQADLFVDNRHEGEMLLKPIALLLENIPACEQRNEPAHQHMDFLYLAKPLNESQPLCLAEEEGADIRWFTASDINDLDATTDIFANVKHYILSILS